MDSYWATRHRSFSQQSSSSSANEKQRVKVVGEHHDGSFGVYMSHKIQKLEAENHKLQESLRCSSIFEGIAIFVNGYTVPSKEELRLLILKHGGRFEFYETSTVTHIIATHLPFAKVRQYKKMRKPKPVVSPSWIVQSIEQMRLLSYRSFLHEAFRDSKQPSIDSAAMRGFVPAVTSTTSLSDDNEPEIEETESEIPAAIDSISDEHAEKILSTTDTEKKTLSSKDGAEFVKNYFEKSRLHHIGTWRSRFQHEAPYLKSLYQRKGIVRGSAQGNERVILHVDMDCFFVSIALRAHPEREKLKNVPLAVAHSSAARTSEISSCNYVARAYGVRAGMFMGKAKELCSDLTVLSYDFAEIEKVSMEIYSIFFEHTPYVQAMSCDEAFLEFSPGENGLEIANVLRRIIYQRTNCPASVGISYNILLAKLATASAKPDGVYQIASPNEADSILLSSRVEDLPGIGKKTTQRLHSHGVETVDQLRTLRKSELISYVGGQKLGDTLYNFARGIDIREVSMEASLSRKSVSAVINYGIRFESRDDSVVFLHELAKEVERRLHEAGMSARCITLQIKRRRAGEPIEPTKYMGCGICDDIARSQVLPEPTAHARSISRVALELLEELRLPVQDLRGVGILATKLTSSSRQVAPALGSKRFRRATLHEMWSLGAATDNKLSPPKSAHYVESSRTSTKEQTGKARKSDIIQSNIRDVGARATKESWLLPTLSQIDPSTLRELPAVIQDEITAALSKEASKQVNKRVKPREMRKESIKSRKKSKQNKANPVSSKIQCSGNILKHMTSLDDIRFSQVDAHVYNELPLQLRHEVRSHTITSTGNNPMIKLATSSTIIKKEIIDPQPLFSIQQLVSESLQSPLTQSRCTLNSLDTDAWLFDSIYARLLHEIEQRNLARVLHLLRYTRRKCAECLAQSTVNARPNSEERFERETYFSWQQRVRNGFNQMLQRVHDDTMQRYRVTLASCAITPL